jgi:hypothetical protein
MSVQIKLRRDTAANWVTVNPVLAAGEPGVETDTLKWKFGDGITHWNQLNYPTILSTPTSARDLTGTTLPANIVNSSLTSVGVLTNLTVSNPINGSITGNAVTATTAANATNAINAQFATSASTASNLSGGTSNQIMYQTGSGTGFITVPASPTTFLEWNGTGFSWATVPPTAAGNITGSILASNVVTSSLTAVGTLTNLTVSNTISGSVSGSAGSVSGANITGGTLASNVLASSLTSVGTLTNLAVTNPIAGTISGSAGSVAAGNITGSILASNVLTSSLTSVGTLASLNVSGLQYISVNYISVTLTASFSLSSTITTNVLQVSSSGYTATLNMPTSPTNGQLCVFSITGNSVTLTAGTGTLSPTFTSGSAQSVGTVYKYVYNSSNTTWYRI